MPKLGEEGDTTADRGAYDGCSCFRRHALETRACKGAPGRTPRGNTVVTDDEVGREDTGQVGAENVVSMRP
jgi:hypothetical protein